MWIDDTFLEKSFSLAGLSQEFAAGLVKIARPVHLKAGQTLFVAGDPGNGFYSVIEGSL